MSERAEGSKKENKGKKPHKNHHLSYKYKQYSSEGKKNSRECIKCGAGIFLAKHKDRLSCGKCGYTEFLGK